MALKHKYGSAGIDSRRRQYPDGQFVCRNITLSCAICCKCQFNRSGGNIGRAWNIGCIKLSSRWIKCTLPELLQTPPPGMVICPSSTAPPCEQILWPGPAVTAGNNWNFTVIWDVDMAQPSLLLVANVSVTEPACTSCAEAT